MGAELGVWSQSLLLSPLLFFQPSGDALLSRNGLYSLLAKMSFPKAYLSYPVRAGRIISDNREFVMSFVQNDVWIFVFISLVDKLQVSWYRSCHWTFLCHDQVQVSVYRCQDGVSHWRFCLKCECMTSLKDMSGDICIFLIFSQC